MPEDVTGYEYDCPKPGCDFELRIPFVKDVPRHADDSYAFDIVFFHDQTEHPEVPEA